MSSCQQRDFFFRGGSPRDKTSPLAAAPLALFFTKYKKKKNHSPLAGSTDNNSARIITHF